jgi:hypothetical protein
MRFMIIRKAVTRWPPIDGHGEVEIEIRQVYELSDLGSAEAMGVPRESQSAAVSGLDIALH